MSEQSSDQLISVPQGGGAISGLGEKFQPDLHTGTGNFSVPLDLPAGRGAMHPSLSLTYSTGNPNGAFGMGWALSVPGVRRRTSKSIPRYDDARDTFVLSGVEVQREPTRSGRHVGQPGRGEVHAVAQRDGRAVVELPRRG